MAAGAGAGRSGRGRSPPRDAGRLSAITVAVAEPQEAAARWAEILGVPIEERAGGPVLLLDGAEVSFTAADGRPEGLVEIAVEAPGREPAAARTLELGAARVRVL